MSMQEKIDALVGRIDNDGTLELGMEDFREGPTFFEVQLTDVRFSFEAIQRAKKVVVVDGKRERVLKDGGSNDLCLEEE